MSEQDELAEALEAAGKWVDALESFPGSESRNAAPKADTKAKDFHSGASQWATSDGTTFVGAATTTLTLPPSMYEINISASRGPFFSKLQVKTEGLLKFPHSNSEKILGEIEKFWDRRPMFREYGLVHKRGILLWGPPGSGKSSTIALIVADVVRRGGVAIKFDSPGTFIMGMRLLREVQPDTPVVVLMEDLDTTIKHYSESDILNILDGVEMVDRVVFLASTNYPEMLGPRIVNRPSRFDKRFKIGHPTPASRLMYFEHLLGARAKEYPVAQWISDTEGMSLAHLKELFVAVVILGDEYKEALATLRSMKENISSDSERQRMGLRA
jgi:ATPase family protein associated with various cellular activities (AAA)